MPSQARYPPIRPGSRAGGPAIATARKPGQDRVHHIKRNVADLPQQPGQGSAAAKSQVSYIRAVEKITQRDQNAPAGDKRDHMVDAVHHMVVHMAARSRSSCRGAFRRGGAAPAQARRRCGAPASAGYRRPGPGAAAPGGWRTASDTPTVSTGRPAKRAVSTVRSAATMMQAASAIWSGGEKVFGAVGSVGFHLNPHAKLPRGLFQRFGSHIGVGHPHRAGCHCQHQRAGGRGLRGQNPGRRRPVRLCAPSHPKIPPAFGGQQ